MPPVSPAGWDDPFVPIRPVADEFGRPVKTIYRWVREGVIRHRRDDQDRILISMDDFLKAQRTRGRRHHHK